MLTQKTCQRCGKGFRGGPRAWYCPECRKERERERRKKYNTYGTERKIGSVDTCKCCGKQYTVSSGTQKYCKECAEPAVKEIDREQGLEWYRKNAEKINPKRNEARRKIVKICVICGNEFQCDGTCRNTCSEGCRKEQKRIWQRRGDEKRRRRKDGE